MAVFRVGSDGKAPKEARPGDHIVTGGGTYRIGDDGKGSLVNRDQTTKNYGGSYANSSSNNSGSSASGSGIRHIGSGGTSGSSQRQGRTFRVGSDGKAPKEARPGDHIVTGGGTYRIGDDGKGILINKGQTTGNYRGEYANRNVSGSIATDNRGTQPSGKVWQVGSDGKAPKGAKPGDLVVTKGGTYKIGNDGRGILVDRKQGSASVATSPSAGTGTYNINTPKGQEQVKNMNPGDYFKAGDNSTWFKNLDGSITVQYPDGRKLKGVLGNGQQTATNTGSMGNAYTYTVESDEGKNILKKLLNKEMDSFTADDGTVWKLDAIGNPYVTTKDGKSMLIASSALGNPNSMNQNQDINKIAIMKMIEEGKYEKTVKDADSNQDVFLVNSGGQKLYVLRDGTVAGAGMRLKTVDSNGIPAIATLYQDLEGNYFEGVNTHGNRAEVWNKNKDGKPVYDENLSAKGFYFYNDRIYNSQTGKSVRLDEDMPEDALFFYNGRWYDRSGTPTTGVNPLVDQMNIEDETLNSIIREFLKQYYDTTDFNNYNVMSRDEALGRANEQLRSQYDDRLKNTIDSMKQAALNTGFFGQLPAEALYSQAAAANEVDLQAAINDLANDLYRDSFNQAYTRFNADRTSQNAALNTLSSAMNAYNNYNTEQFGERQQSMDNILNAIKLLYGLQSDLTESKAQGRDTRSLEEIYNRAVEQINNMNSMYKNR